MMMLPARFHPASCDRKLSPVDLVDVGMPRPRPTPRAPFVSSTYVSIEGTCLDSCPFKRNGCYVDAGFTKFAGDLLDQAVLKKTPEQIVAIEARLIDEAFAQKLKRTPFGMRAVGGVPQDGARGGRDLRLHVGGDAPTTACARILAGAAERWLKRRGGRVWTYTHAWAHVPRAAWGVVSVLASVESPEQFAAARAQGYAPAIVVERHTSVRAYELHGVKVIPCPAETRATNCASCRLCLDADALFARNAGIAFALHGQQAELARPALAQLKTGRAAA